MTLSYFKIVISQLPQVFGELNFIPFKQVHLATWRFADGMANNLDYGP